MSVYTPAATSRRRQTALAVMVVISAGVALVASLVGPAAASAANPQATAQVGSAVMVGAASPKLRATRPPARCKGHLVSRQQLLMDGKLYGELVVYYATARKGTLCAMTKHLGRYKGVAKKSKRRVLDVYMCLSDGDDSCAGRGTPFTRDRGPYKYYAGPVRMVGTNGHTIHVYGASYNPGGANSDHFAYATVTRRYW